MHIITWQVRYLYPFPRPRAFHPLRRYYNTSEERISASELQELNLHSSKYRKSVITKPGVWVHKYYYYKYGRQKPLPHKSLLFFKWEAIILPRLHCWGSSLGTTLVQKQQESALSSPTTTWVRKPWVRSVLSQVLPVKIKDSQGYAGLRE
jgi:hypothetical protein